MPNNELQELLGTRFNRYTHSTNESVWIAIEAQLDSKQANRIGIWFWIFNGLAATLLIGIMTQSTIRTELVANSQVSKTSIQEKITVEQTEISDKNENRIENQTEAQIESQADNRSKLIEFDIASSKKTSTDNSTIRNSSASEDIKKKLMDPKIDQDVLHREKEISGRNQLAIETNEEFEFGKRVTLFTDVNQLSSYSIASQLNEPNDFDVLPKSIVKTKLGYFKLLPIHLGANVTYLQRLHVSKNWALITNTTDNWADDQLYTNRHFEFNVFSQFDLTKRFSASIGFAYSRSLYSKAPSSGSISSFNSDLIISNQRLFAVPIEAKFAFIRKKRFGLSLGLSAHGEFGRILHAATSSQENWAVISNPQQLTDPLVSVAKQQIRQFALEPFIQVSYGISPRISLFTNLGYRTYLKSSINGTPSATKLNYLTTDFGIKFRIH